MWKDETPTSAPVHRPYHGEEILKKCASNTIKHNAHAQFEVERLLAEHDEACNADERAPDCESESISMAMYHVHADGRIGPCTSFMHSCNH